MEKRPLSPGLIGFTEIKQVALLFVVLLIRNRIRPPRGRVRLIGRARATYALIPWVRANSAATNRRGHSARGCPRDAPSRGRDAREADAARRRQAMNLPRSR